MKTLPNERTTIKIIASVVKAYCHRCKKEVCPNVIISAFLDLPLSVCPNCHSVIQGNVKNERKS